MNSTRHLINILLTVPAALLFAACSREPQSCGPDPAGETYPITLQAVFGDALDAGTKVAIAGTSGANFAWSAGDQIAVHSSDGSYHVLTLLTGAGEASATFEGELNGTQNFYAVYPATAKVDANYGNSTLQVTLPAFYNDISGSMGTSSPLPMIAVNTGSTLSFKHVGAMYRLTLDDVPAGTSQITVTFDKDVTGTFTVTNPGTNAPYIATTTGSTGRTVTFNLSSALTAETDGFVLNVPVPTGTYAGNIKVVATGGTMFQAKIPNPRTIARASGRQISKALEVPTLPEGFGGPFTYNGVVYYISQGNMYKTASGYALYSDWTGGLDKYNGTAPDTQTWTGNSYFNWLHLAGLFDTSIDTGTDDDIDNDKTPISGCKLPTREQWAAFTTRTSRPGSSVNGVANCRYAFIRLTGYTNNQISNPRGLLLIPDNATLTGMAKTFTWNTNSTSGNTGVTVAQLNEYLSKGAVFLPASGAYGGGWYDGGSYGPYWSASASGSNYAYFLFFDSSDSDVDPAGTGNKSSNYFPVRVLQE